MPDLHGVGLDLFIFFSVLSLTLVVSKPVAKEFEATALEWVRALKRIQTELKAPDTIEQPSQPPQGVSQTGSKHELR